MGSVTIIKPDSTPFIAIHKLDVLCSLNAKITKVNKIPTYNPTMLYFIQNMIEAATPTKNDSVNDENRLSLRAFIAMQRLKVSRGIHSSSAVPPANALL